MSEVRFWMLVVSACIAVAGLCAVAGGVGMFRASIRKCRTWRRASGEVVDREKRRKYDQSESGDTIRYEYLPVIAFRDQHGDTRRFTGEEVALWRPRIGSRRVVLYDPEDPGDACIRSLFRLLMIPFIVTAFGLVAAAGGIALALRGGTT